MMSLEEDDDTVIESTTKRRKYVRESVRSTLKGQCARRVENWNAV